MFVVLVATDRPGSMALRARTKERHKQYLDAGAPDLKVLQSGPLLATDGSERGSLIVFEANSVEYVHTFVEEDPYFRAGLFEAIEIQPWDWRRGNPYLSTNDKEIPK
ncbi:YciI family protein [Ensifer adhaerens]|uniref:YciI family protein n=1 Tax=Ensifer adhaerens TaxID=106592 RepID=UPI000FD837E7|nr:YciI family protein [Ensifer adhaerens]MDF8357650.1 YciI family protein [Ensifer adhaerens]THA60205.1 YciI family protein [Ensifer adhaerens]